MSKISSEKIHSFVLKFLSEHKDNDLSVENVIEKWDSDDMKTRIKEENFYKTSKDPNKPKKNTSSYLFFCSENRRSVRKELGDVPKATDITKELAKRWNILRQKTDQESLSKIQHYETLGIEDKKRYEEEMLEYNKTLPKKESKNKSAFMFFYEDKIESVKITLPQNHTKKELKEKMSKIWKEEIKLNKEEFKKYKALSKEYSNNK
jgi:hypothetical protein